MAGKTILFQTTLIQGVLKMANSGMPDARGGDIFVSIQAAVL